MGDVLTKTNSDFSILNLIKGVKEKSFKELQRKSWTSNTIFWIDHFSEQSTTSFVRHTIQVDRDGGFSVHRFKIVAGDMNFNVEAKKIGATVYHQFEAKSMVEQRITVLELEGWVFMDERDCSIYNVSQAVDSEIEKVLYIAPIVPVEVSDFVGEGYVKIQKVTSGMRCFIYMDPFGEIFIKTSSKNRVKWERASSAIKNKFNDLCAVEGSRGFVLEIIVNGTAISISDVLYYHNSWCVEDDKETRLKSFASYLEGNNLLHIHNCLMQLQRVGVHAVNALITRDTVGALISNGKARFIVANTANAIYFGSGHKGKYTAQCDNTLSILGVFENNHVPDLSYLTFNSAASGANMFLY